MKFDMTSERPILLVEDTPLDLDLALRAFKKTQLTNPIEVARDGEEVLAMITEWDHGRPLPLIIILDLKLPKINGFEVLRAIKQHQAYHVIPIIVMTSSAEDKDIRAAYKLGANSYITKPVSFTKLIALAKEIEAYWLKTTTLPRNP
ncbi:response regulator [Desulfosediminicola flagellatus]|uniref:response regulator n=1 Tax=Desulfosediminicola flagellatus TaxID=2569541 RepID=UPI001C3D308A|nr:response regulator [Desulfosediminicola flagellatus]